MSEKKENRTTRTFRAMRLQKKEDHLFVPRIFITTDLSLHDKHFPHKYFDETIKSHPVFNFRDVSETVNLSSRNCPPFSESYRLWLQQF